MPIETLAAGVAAKAVGHVADRAIGSASDTAGDFLAKKSGFNSAVRSFTGEANIAISEKDAIKFLKDTTKYMFYKNFIEGESPNEAQIDTMLYLIAITIDEGNIKFVLNNVTGNDNRTNLENFKKKDFTFLNSSQKKKIIDKLMDSENGISRSIPRREESSTGQSIQEKPSSSPTRVPATKMSGSDLSSSGTSSPTRVPSSSSLTSKAKGLLKRSTPNDEKLRGAEGGGKKRKYKTRRKHKKRTKKKRSKKRRSK